jgi:hypothetical protein
MKSSDIQTRVSELVNAIWKLECQKMGGLEILEESTFQRH